MVAEQRFRRLDGPELLAAVVAAQVYVDGQPVVIPPPAVPPGKREVP